ncbi:hypothetical protein GCM10009854_27840 [Saccharopolyspora halophila]|uniref:AAA family ATPase n=1 Tax=Saccharopolyspora halophila TaxID=405551 RepID=A0ABN3GD38_9PSEU
MTNGARPGGTPDSFEPVNPAALARQQELAARLLNRAQLADLPAPTPLIEDTIDLGTVAVLAGHWGSLKSFIALDWAASVATGRRWQNRATEPKRVLYVAAEGAYGLHQRLDAWERAWNQTIHPDELAVYPEPANLGHVGTVDALAAVIDSHGFGLVVVDTLAKSMVGMDENSSQDMGTAVGALYTLQKATGGGTVLAVHHTGKDKTTIRGSSALEAGVDTVYMTEGDASQVKLSRTKRKDGPKDDVHTLALQTITGSESGAVVSAIGADITGKASELLSVFMSAFSETGASKAELRNSAEMAPATFHRALNELVSEGALINEGTDRRAFYRLGET